MSTVLPRLRTRLALSVGTLLLSVVVCGAQTDPIDGQTTPAPADSSETGERFHWGPALAQSGFLLAIQNSMRMLQEKTRDHLGGPFWHDYVESVQGLHGWDDGNPWPTNYLGHPMMGAIAGFIQVQNDPHGKTLEWDPHNRQYWTSRLKGLAWATGYSTTFELSPIGEAGIGNVGQDPGTAAWVDLIVTPLAGFGLMILEDYVDAHIIKRVEQGKSPLKARFLRVLMNPDRGLANMMRLERPSHRDTRPSPP